MTNTPNLPSTRPNPYDPAPGALFTIGRGNWQNRTYEQVFPGDSRPISDLPYGAIFEQFGERFIISAKTSKTALVRSLDTGEHSRMSVHSLVIVHDRDTGAYVPPRGCFVQIVKGEHIDKIGFVAQPGKNSMHVVFPGDRDVYKFSAAQTKVIQVTIIPN